MILELSATPQEVMRAVETLQEFAQAEGVPEKTIFGLALALEECSSNVVNHALQRDAQQKFQVVIENSSGSFVIELRDRGPEFDPTAAAERKPEAEDDDLPGGWGIQLVRRYVDEIRYQREAGENVLCLTKRLDIPAAAPIATNFNHPIPHHVHHTRLYVPAHRQYPSSDRFLGDQPDGLPSRAESGADREVGLHAAAVGEADAMPLMRTPEVPGWEWKTETRTGEVVQGIVDAAHESDADLVVISTDGRSGFLEALRGSHTEQVLQRVPAPLLAAPEGSTAEKGLNLASE